MIPYDYHFLSIYTILLKILHLHFSFLYYIRISQNDKTKINYKKLSSYYEFFLQKYNGI